MKSIKFKNLELCMAYTSPDLRALHRVSIVKPFYKKATPIDLQIEEKKDYVQFNDEAITEWNIDGKSEYQIKTVIKQMLIYSSAAKIKGNNDRQIAQAIITGFTGQLQGWWDFYLSKGKEKMEDDTPMTDQDDLQDAQDPYEGDDIFALLNA